MGMGKCSISLSSLAMGEWVTQTCGHRGLGTTLEKFSSLPAPAAEPRQPEGKNVAPLTALTVELNTGNISGAVVERRTRGCPSQNG